LSFEVCLLKMILFECPSKSSVPLLSVDWKMHGTAVITVVSFQVYSMYIASRYIACIFWKYFVALSEKASVEESGKVNFYFISRNFVIYWKNILVDWFGGVSIHCCCAVFVLKTAYSQGCQLPIKTYYFGPVKMGENG